MPPTRKPGLRRLTVSASALSQMGVCERLVVFEHVLGHRRTASQSQAIRRGLRAHRRFHEDGLRDSARSGRCSRASLAFAPSASQFLALRIWLIGRCAMRLKDSVASAPCVWQRHHPAAMSLIGVLRSVARCVALWIRSNGD